MYIRVPFQASNDDELNLYENEELEVIADGEGDGWVKVSHQESIEIIKDWIKVVLFVIDILNLVYLHLLHIFKECIYVQS